MILPQLLPLALLLQSGCTDYSYTQLSRKDTFQQVRRNTVDILLVVDDSCSMVEEQDKLAANFDGFLSAFADADVDWRIAAVTTDTADRAAAGRLVGGGDELELRTPDGRLLDRLAWTADWPVGQGVALQLDPGVVDPGEADAATVWCAAISAYDGPDLGTPGEDNAPCGAGGPPLDSGSSDTGSSDTGSSDTGSSDTGSSDTGWGGARAPLVGEVLISELMVAPTARPDATGEWVELRSLATVDLDLSGHRLADDTGHGATLPDGTRLSAGASLVLGRSDQPWVDLVLDADPGEGLRLADPVKVISPDLSDAAELFAELVAVGTGGAGIEMGLEAARLALVEPDIAAANGFLRDDANLSLIFLSDEDDQSPDPTADYLRDLGALKGDAAFRTPGVLTVSAVAGVQPPAYEGALACESADGAAEYGARFVALAQATGGAAESICDDDFSAIAYELGLTASGLTTTFVLSEPADAGSLQVSLYDDADEASLVAALVQGEDYRFDSLANAVVFEAGQVPPSESWIVVEYELLATGQEVVE